MANPTIALAPDPGQASAPAPLWSDLLAAYAGVGAERPWFAEGAIEGSPIIMFSGPEKSHKSWSAMQLAAATVVGGPWLERFPVRRPGPVVYLDGEYGEHEFARRVVRLSRGMGAEPTDVLRNIRHFYSAQMTLTPGDGALRKVLSAIGAERPSLVVLDPLRNHLDGSENDSDVIVRAYKCLDALRGAGQCPVLVIHHLNKSGGFSGSRAITTRADFIVEGSDTTTPTYTARGRTLRPALDSIAQPFVIDVTHENDHDDRIAATRLAWRSAEAPTRGGKAACSPEQLAKVRTYIEGDRGCSLVLAHVAEGAHVNKSVARAAMIALEGELVLSRPKDENGNHAGWDHL